MGATGIKFQGDQALFWLKVYFVFSVWINVLDVWSHGDLQLLYWN